ncbi:response regulator [Desulfobacterales bacterium HSG16]|nr:response regulator [Desulfobacterales bacterium HSG16]
MTNDSSRILIIDDNQNIFNDFKTILIDTKDETSIDTLAADFFGKELNEKKNINTYELDYAPQGAIGVEKISLALKENRPYALAFVDMRMPPGWDGLETIEHLWKIDPHVQVVICTAFSDYSWDEIVKRLGKTDQLLILKKPFDSAEVAQLASALTKKWNLFKKTALKMDEIEQIVQTRTIELKKTEEALISSNKKMLEQQKSVIQEERLKVLLQLSGAIAYELNQPLLALLAQISSIKKVYENKDMLDIKLAKIDEDSQKLFEILEKIKIIHQNIPIDIQPAKKTKSKQITFDSEIRILSVEDTKVDFALLKALIGKIDNVSIFRAENINSGIDALHNESFDLIFLDHQLPDGNGFDFLKLMEQNSFYLPVVVITGQGDEMIASKFIQAGAYEYLPKFKTSVLALSRIINNTLEKARLKKDLIEAQNLMIKLSTTDHLTGLYNRRYFEEALKKEKIESQLQQSQKMEAIGTLAGGIAHDFNNMLSVIIGNAELALYNVPESNPARKNLEAMKNAGLRAKDIVQQLLSFSRTSEQKQKPVNICPIIKDALIFLRSSIPTSIKIRKTIPDESVIILADPTQIHQVIINLCINAAHAMNEGGIMEVNLSIIETDKDEIIQETELNEGQYVKITVSDTGRGIAKEHLDKIFDPYFTTKEIGKGSGIGLSVVHGIVNSHNGEISVDSEYGKGTTFKVFFPVVEKEPVYEEETDITVPTGDERILFIDDEKSIVDMAIQMLEQFGYTVTAKTSSADALETFRTRPDKFDLIISDISMPEITGDKLAKELLQIRPDIPIILCTGYSSRINDEKAKEIGIRDLVMKPIVKSVLAKTIRKVLDQS